MTSRAIFVCWPHPLPGRIFAVAELSGDGRLDLLGLSETGQPLRLVNQGTTDYFWLTLRPRAAPVPGDGRINTFALGGEVDVRAGLLYQKQPITGPVLHFGWANTAAPTWYASSGRTVMCRRSLSYAKQECQPGNA